MSHFGPHAAFILTAYAVALGGLAAMALVSWRRMRALEQRVAELRAARRRDA